MRRPDARSEARLEALRDQARRHGKVEAPGVRPAGSPMPSPPPAADPATGEGSYYGLPVLKEPTWTWEVPVYFFVGGAAGAAAVVAAAARASGGDRELVRDARWVAALGAAASAPLLVSDLGRPERFLHMLRIFKPQSAMSVGAWTLTAFGSATAAAAFADLVAAEGRGPVRVVADAAGLLGAATGLGMATYTGVLVGVTAIPVWSRSVRLLPIHFAASGLASATALLELAGHRDRALGRLGLVAAVVETLIGAWKETRRERVFAPLHRGRSGALIRAGGVLSGPVPLALRLVGRRRTAAVSALAGSLLTRFGWVEAGRVSARDPSLVL